MLFRLDLGVHFKHRAHNSIASKMHIAFLNLFATITLILFKEIGFGVVAEVSWGEVYQL